MGKRIVGSRTVVQVGGGAPIANADIVGAETIVQVSDDAVEVPDGWLACFDEHQRRLIANCQLYASHDPAGLPGHQLMLIISRMAVLLDERGEVKNE